MQHTAIYYDGQTSQPHEAQIEVFGNSLSIHYEGKKVVWAISEVGYGSFSGRGKTILQYGAFPHQYLEYHNDTPLALVLSGYLPNPQGSSGPLSKQYNAILKAVLIGIAIFSAIAAGIYFILIPSVASYVAEKIPVKTEIALGEKFYENFMKNSETDAGKTKLLTEFSRHINFNTKYPLKFTVVKEPQVNAFALPGGNIVVYSRILNKIKSAEELAALLAHEVSHVKQRHSLKGLARRLTGSLLISLVVGDTGAIENILINHADDIYQSGFSRDMEREADLKGLQIMFENRLPPEGMVYLMERLHEEEKHGSTKMLAYLNSHPMTEERITYIKENSKGKSGTSNKKLDFIWDQIQGSVTGKY